MRATELGSGAAVGEKDSAPSPFDAPSPVPLRMHPGHVLVEMESEPHPLATARSQIVIVTNNEPNGGCRTKADHSQESAGLKPKGNPMLNVDSPFHVISSVGDGNVTAGAVGVATHVPVHVKVGVSESA
jgi:hypothetical protein